MQISHFARIAHLDAVRVSEFVRIAGRTFFGVFFANSALSVSGVTTLEREYLVELGVHRTALRDLFSAGKWYVHNLPRRRLPGQREHLVHSYPGSDRCIAQTGFANRFPHALRSKFSHVSQL